MPPAFATAIATAFERFPDTPGVVVAVHRPDLGFAVSAHGRDLACEDPACTERPMPVDGVFEIGSVTKSVRWILLHLLAEQGLLALDDPVSDYVTSPELPGVTLRDLVHHASGLIDIVDDPIFEQAVLSDPTRAFSREESLGLLMSAHGTLDDGARYASGRIEGFRVGLDVHYSNFGSVVAGAVLEAVTGREARALVQERILDRLRLAGTSHVFHDPRPARVVQGYHAPRQPNTAVLDVANTAAVSTLVDGLLYSTACDLVHLVHAELGDASFLQEETRNAITSDVVDAGGGTLVGLGLIRYGAAPDFWGHLGAGIHGHSSLMLHRPTDRLSIVVLANIDANADHWQTHLAIVDALDGS